MFKSDVPLLTIMLTNIYKFDPHTVIQHDFLEKEHLISQGAEMSAQLDKARLRFAGERLRNQPGMAREAGEASGRHSLRYSCAFSSAHPNHQRRVFLWGRNHHAAFRVGIGRRYPRLAKPVSDTPKAPETVSEGAIEFVPAKEQHE
jgi:hypothetical protein